MGHAIGFVIKKVNWLAFLVLVAVFVSASAFICFLLFVFLYSYISFQTIHTQIYSGVFLLGCMVGYMRIKFEWPN
jgi:hypothetical protein